MNRFNSCAFVCIKIRMHFMHIFRHFSREKGKWCYVYWKNFLLLFSLFGSRQKKSLWTDAFWVLIPISQEIWNFDGTLFSWGYSGNSFHIKKGLYVLFWLSSSSRCILTYHVVVVRMSMPPRYPIIPWDFKKKHTQRILLIYIKWRDKKNALFVHFVLKDVRAWSWLKLLNLKWDFSSLLEPFFFGNT